MPPPARPVVDKARSSQVQRLAPLNVRQREQSAARTDPESDSLFLPGGDEDQTWDPPNYNVNDGEEMLGWDANNEHPSASFHPTFHDSGSVARPLSQQQQRPTGRESQDGLEPTQRLSQVRRICRHVE